MTALSRKGSSWEGIVPLAESEHSLQTWLAVKPCQNKVLAGQITHPTLPGLCMHACWREHERAWSHLNLKTDEGSRGAAEI